MQQVQMVGGIEGGFTLPEGFFIVYIVWASNALPPGLLPAHVIGLPAHKQGFPTLFHAAATCDTYCYTVPSLNSVADLYIVAIVTTIGDNILHCVLAVMTTVITVLQNKLIV